MYHSSPTSVFTTNLAILDENRQFSHTYIENLPFSGRIWQFGAFLCDFGTNALINKVGLTRPVSLYK